MDLLSQLIIQVRGPGTSQVSGTKGTHVAVTLLLCVFFVVVLSCRFHFGWLVLAAICVAAGPYPRPECMTTGRV